MTNSFIMACLTPLLTILLALPASSPGVLELRSQPGVEILWEGVALGETDASGLLVIEGIPPGEYHLILRKPGFHELDTRIEVGEGSGSTRELFLEPLQAPEGAPIEPGGQVGQGAGDQPEVPPLDASKDSPGGLTSTGSEAMQSFPPILGAIAALVALAGAIGVGFLVRHRKASPRPQMAPDKASEPPFEGEEIPVFEESDQGSPGFLEDLKRRERHLGDASETPSQSPEETVIEVEAIEIHPADVRPMDDSQ